MTDERHPQLDAERLFATLGAHDVDYIVIGGFAVIAHGHVRATKDVDFVASRAPVNLRRLAAALGELNARLRGVDAELLPVLPTNPDDLGAGGNWTMVTDAGWLDFMNDVPGGTDYHQLRARSVLVELGDVQIRIVGLDDLIGMKRAAGRPRDLADIAALTAQLE